MFLERGNGVYDIVMLRDGQKVEFNDMKLVPTIESLSRDLNTASCGALKGRPSASNANTSGTRQRSFHALSGSASATLSTVAVGVDEMAGPVGIVDMMNEVGSSAASTADAVYSMLYFSAFIAINLAIMNMLPIPALDGGRVFFMIVTVIFEAITKRKPDPKYEGYIHAGGMVLLLLLMGFIMYNDIARLITG